MSPPPPRYAATRVEVHWRIAVNAPGSYSLIDDHGAVVRQGPKPRALSDWGLDNGATHVVWAAGVPW